MGFLGFLAGPLGYVMQFLYSLVNNYGWALIIFTVLIRVLMFPLSLKQQKSTARNAAYQPMMQEIQKKWANDKQKQQEEMMKFQQENNIKMTAGCGSMLVNFVVLFSVIEVIYRPLSYILRMPAEVLDAATAVMETASNAYTMQSRIIGEVIAGNSVVMDALGTTWTENIQNFNFHFMGLNMAQTPTWSLEAWPYLVLPVLSLLTMFLSQVIVMKTSGNTQGRGMMIGMTVMMGVLFGTYAFTVPVAFSLYYTVGNVLMMVQQLISRKIYDPEKFKEQIREEIEERKRQKKAKKVVKIADASGAVVEKEMSDADLAKLRLQKARELDAARYAEEEREAKQAAEAVEKARKADEEKYGKTPDKKPVKEEEIEPEVIEAVVEAQPEEQAEEEKAPEQPRPEYKPGRRKRARENKKQNLEPASFADKEQDAENSKGGN